MSALRKPAPATTPAEVPGLSYYAAAVANLAQKPAPVLTALDQMYGYWSRE